jgi:hypothetical protein
MPTFIWRSRLVVMLGAGRAVKVELVDDHLEQHLDELFFTKLTDWESEVEYRYIVRWEGDDANGGRPLRQPQFLQELRLLLLQVVEVH